MAADPGRLRATFAQLCDCAVSTIEYLEWAHTYENSEIARIPLLDNTNPEAQQRFIHLIDILVDADIRVTFISPHSLTDFLATANSRPDCFRMISRMQLLQNNIGANWRDGVGRCGYDGSEATVPDAGDDIPPSPHDRKSGM